MKDDKLGFLSNFAMHEPFDYVAPFGKFSGEGPFPIQFTETAIMLNKASLMGDKDSFLAIAEAKSPLEAKRLGRKVAPWDEDLWKTHVCAIARDVTIAKFSKVDGFRERLLGIGTRGG